MPDNGSQKRVIAFVIYPGLTPFDLVGPLAVLTKVAEFDPRYETVVVSESLEPVVGDNGITYIPNKTFSEVPHPFAIFIPGGSTPTLKAMSNTALRRYVRSASKNAAFTGSVCTGALILAAVGLLDGLETTTHWAYSGILNALGARYVRKRWVENGKIINSAGVSAGVDMALFFATRLTDEAIARKVQLWLDYDPQPPYGGIDWARLPLEARLLRTYQSLAAPFTVSKPKRMRKEEEVASV